MSRVFDGTDDRLQLASTFGEPFTVSLWFFPTDNTITQILFIQQDATASQYHELSLDGPNARIRALSTAAGVPIDEARASGVNFNAWNHAYGVFGSTNYCALNGGALDSGTGDTPSTNRCRVGARQTVAIPATFDRFFTGSIAELAVIAADLETVNTDYRIRLAAGYSPEFVEDLFTLGEYWPFYGRDKGLIGGVTWTAQGNPTYGDNPDRMIYPPQAQKVRRTPPAFVAKPRSYGYVIG